MIELKGNLFEPDTYRIMTPPTRGRVPANILPEAIVITTNGFVKSDGRAVMGRGCAQQAKNVYYPHCDFGLGVAIQNNSNKCQSILTVHDATWVRHLVAFPVKPVSGRCGTDKSNVVKHMRHRFEVGQRVPGWAMKADIHLIRESARELAQLAYEHNWTKVVLPRPGCGAGELYWESVKQVIKGHLDDRFYTITF